MGKEIWKTIDGFPKYQVSNFGKVRGIGRHGNTYKPLRLANFRGYRTVLLYPGRIRRRIHRLVLEAFVGPKPSPEHVACHLNDIKDDNRVENLVWGTSKENHQHSVKNGTANIINHPMAKLTVTQVLEIKKRYRRYSYSRSNVAELAIEYSVSKSTISKIANNKSHNLALARLEKLCGEGKDEK